MNTINKSYTQLLHKIDEFTRKYYLNKLLRGFIYAGGIIITYFLLINLLEYFFFLPTIGRKILFYSFILIGLGIIVQLILLPLFHYYRLGKIISHEQAAKILGTHFNEIADKLLNVLQLKQQADIELDQSLLLASINQKIESLKPIPFNAAIDLKQNRKYLKFLLLPLLCFVLVFFASPNLIKESSKRLLYNNTVFQKPAPFQFNIQNKNLKAIQFEDFELTLKMSGNSLPQEIYINVEGYSYKMIKKNASTFTYQFSNLQKDINFYFAANGFNSKQYLLKVLAKPMITKFEVALDYPAYTGRQDETLNNIGDLTFPTGTKIKWQFDTKNTTSLRIAFADSSINNLQANNQSFTLIKTFTKSTQYKILVSGNELPQGDSVVYAINVIPDQFPAIYLQTFTDSVLNQYVYFSGDISDDYGLSKLQLKYKITQQGQDSGNESYSVENVNFTKSSRQSTFNYYWNIKSLNLKPGEQLAYFFEVWDNDGVNGSKSTKSGFMQLAQPTIEEVDALADKSNEKIKDKLSESIDKAADLKKELENIKDRMMDKKNLSWEDKKSIEKVLDQQKSLENDLEELKKDMASNSNLQKEMKNRSQEIIKKQEAVQKMFDELMSDEMKKLYEQLESMLDELNKKDALEKIEDFKLTEEQLEKELDRMLSLFKSLELEQKMRDAVDKLKQMSEEQKQLSKETENAKQEENKNLSEKQDALNKQFDEFKKDLEKLEQLSKEAEKPTDLDEQQKESDEISKEMNEGKQNLNQNKNKKASENQKSAAEQMQQMSEQMQSMMDGMEMEQMEEDMKAIRQLLENLITLSLDQEKLMNEVQKVNTNDPKYITLIQQQKKIKDDTKMVEDSLFALSKRVFELQAFINKEIRELNKNLGKSLENLEARQKFVAAKDQQFIMTGFNNLALMLSEAMEQMQQQMAQQMKGDQMCQKNNGKKSGKKPGLSQMQKQLNDQMNNMQQQIKSGKTPGKGEMSKQMAEMAQKQAAMRDALKKMMDEEGQKDKNGKPGGQDGLGGELQKLMEQMDKSETELANKQLTEQLLKRQQEIFTKLLEAEESIRKREKDEKRESNSAEDILNKMPPSLAEYLKKREAEIQLYKTVPPQLKPYYKQLVESYFKNIQY